MKKRLFIAFGVAFLVLCRVANPNQAEDTTIRIDGYASGATPFISNVHLTASDASVLKSIQFTISPKPGSVTRPLSATYANAYLINRNFENPHTGEITLPVFGLYDGYTNTVRLTYRFLDGSSKQANMSITTVGFQDPCGYKTPIVLQRRTNNRDLSYDYILAKGGCSDFAPAIIDTDGALRWVGTAGVSQGSAIFFDNAVYLGHGRKLSRVELDGAVTELADYSNLGVTGFNHDIDRGKHGIILKADTTTA